MRGIPRRIPALAAALFGAALFSAIAWAVTSAGVQGPVTRQLVLKGAMAGAALACMVAIGRPRRVWGLAAPKSWVEGTILPAIAGGVIGALCSGLIIGLGLPPMAGISEVGILQMIGAVWFGSTIAEELFVRGLVQGWMQPVGTERSVWRFSDRAWRVGMSGLLFGGMHLSLLLTATDRRTVAMIVVATTALGLVCAWSRERSGSLAGPLLAHFGFNACAVVGGAVVMIAQRLLGA